MVSHIVPRLKVYLDGLVLKIDVSENGSSGIDLKLSKIVDLTDPQRHLKSRTLKKEVMKLSGKNIYEFEYNNENNARKALSAAYDELFKGNYKIFINTRKRDIPPRLYLINKN